jgi:hypothetical protein
MRNGIHNTSGTFDKLRNDFPHLNVSVKFNTGKHANTAHVYILNDPPGTTPPTVIMATIYDDKANMDKVRAPMEHRSLRAGARRKILWEFDYYFCLFAYILL